MPHRFVRALGWSALLAASLLAPACSSAPKPAAASDFDALYQKREYSRAYDSASAAYAAASGADKDHAALIAGLSAAALEPPKEPDAQRWLTPLLQSPDQKLAGTASATLGMIAQHKGRHAEAARLLSEAADKLAGNDQARAAMFAGDSLQALGRTPDARTMYDKAAAQATDRLLAQQISARKSTVATDASVAQGAFTVQAGSFSDVQKALAAAAKLQPKAAAAGLPAPRVVHITKDGKTLHAVRIGRFPTRADAQRAQQKLSGEQTVVMVASGE